MNPVAQRLRIVLGHSFGRNGLVHCGPNDAWLAAFQWVREMLSMPTKGDGKDVSPVLDGQLECPALEGTQKYSRVFWNAPLGVDAHAQPPCQTV